MIPAVNPFSFNNFGMASSMPISILSLMGASVEHCLLPRTGEAEKQSSGKMAVLHNRDREGPHTVKGPGGALRAWRLGVKRSAPSVRMVASFEREQFDMNRMLLGAILGVALGITDVLLTLRHGSQLTTALLQAFTSRFALGFLGANVALPLHPVISGVLVGILVSLPDAFGLKAYGGIIGSGVVFGALVGLAVKVWAT
jgi:hypothetical protein